MGSSKAPKVRPEPLPVTSTNADQVEAQRQAQRDAQLRAGFAKTLLAGQGAGYYTKGTLG